MRATFIPARADFSINTVATHVSHFSSVSTISLSLNSAGSYTWLSSLAKQRLKDGYDRKLTSDSHHTTRYDSNGGRNSSILLLQLRERSTLHVNRKSL